MIDLVKVKTDEQLDNIRELFKEYEESLGFDLHFQDFNEEYAGLPGEYAPPDGCLLLALYKDLVAGCVALRKMQEGICELKRMYVRPQYRRKGIGRAMVQEIIAQARAIGYSRVRLDTINTMKEAIVLYRSLGFKEIKAYRYNPIDGANYMELIL